MKPKIFLSILFLTFFINHSFSQTESSYNPHMVFDPSFDSQPGNIYRSGSGAPGPGYWKNEADYKISVKLDDIKNTITGNVEIDYTNNSPDNLSYVWLQLDQNRFEQNSRSSFIRQSDTEKFYGGFDISSVQIKSNGKKSP